MCDWNINNDQSVTVLDRFVYMLKLGIGVISTESRSWNVPRLPATCLEGDSATELIHRTALLKVIPAPHALKNGSRIREPEGVGFKPGNSK